VPRRIVSSALVLGLAAVACGAQPAAFEDPLAGRERRFVAQVADFLGDVGRGVSISVDAEGNPHLAYLAFAERVAEGAPSASRPIGSPAVPAVLEAELVDGVWSRHSVLEEADVGPETSSTGVAVDPGGVHHVAWTERPLGLSYASDQDGQFGEPDSVALGPARGVSIAVGASGAPWIAWYQGTQVRAASGAPGNWNLENVAFVGRGDPGLPVRTSIAVGGDGQPVLAFTDPATQTPMLARRDSSGTWATDEIEDGGGGYGISLDLDTDGNPHVTYYGPLAGTTASVRYATPADASAESVELGTFDAGPGALDPTLVGAGVAVDDQGVASAAWFGGAGTGIVVASNAEGEFQDIPLGPSASTGAAPAVAATPDGSSVYVGWFDTSSLDLQMGIYGVGELVLARPGETTSAPPPTQPGGGGECPEDSAQITASAQASVNGFDTTSVPVPASEGFTLCFNNQDPGGIHNVQVFDGADGEAPLLFDTGPAAAGPLIQTADAPPLDPASYFFNCVVHPTTMTGTLEAA
jgi:hypothetical protein